MAKQYEALLPEQVEFIEEQAVFFVATAAAEARINLSPKGMDSLVVQDPRTLLWLNLTGSGNETAAHVLADGRMTLMWCSFAGKPGILRVYGQARVFHVDDPGFVERAAALPDLPAARQIFELSLDLVQFSCGFGVPRMELLGTRETLQIHGAKKSPEQLRAYWRDKNQRSIDGLPTGTPVSSD